MFSQKTYFRFSRLIRGFVVSSLIFQFYYAGPPACLGQENVSRPARQRAATGFSFKRYLFGPPLTLSASIDSLNPTTGSVTVNGVETQSVSQTLSWDWGDGSSVSSGWFPQTHIYKDTAKNYVVQVTSHYAGGSEDSVSVAVFFVAPVIKKISLPAKIAVTIPRSLPSLKARIYGVPSTLSFFNDSYFKRQPRLDQEYILSVAAKIQYDFANQNVYRENSAFNQVVLRDGSYTGMYSLWFTIPVSLASGNYGFRWIPQYSSFFHEMGHNVTLNSPGGYFYGGKIDGCANCIFSETMACIFAHATAYEIINHATAYGFNGDLIAEVESSAIPSIGCTRSSYDEYLAGGKRFQSWDSPGTGPDVGKTYSTIVYKFCAHAETGKTGYRVPLKRMMQLLQHFNPTWHVKYDPSNNSSSGAAFRATLMVAALSYAFDTDLRSEFRKLNFPISNSDYNLIISTVDKKTAAR